MAPVLGDVVVVLLVVVETMVVEVVVVEVVVDVVALNRFCWTLRRTPSF